MAVFFRHFSAVPEKDSNRLQVAEGHSQVQRRPTSGIHRLDLILRKIEENYPCTLQQV